MLDEDVGCFFLVGVDPLHRFIQRIHESLVGLGVLLAEAGARPE